MDACDINRMLYRHFCLHEYKLNNSYVFDWESDFFCMSKSNYFIEVEVKVSRGDFFRDFQKEKHGLFKDVSAGKSHRITHYPGHGDLILRNRYKVIQTDFTGDIENKDHSRVIKRFAGGNGWNWEVYNGKPGYWVNDYGRVTLRTVTEDLYAPATRIQFRKIENIHCPNQIYFACPEGLIKLEEIPAYAGLIYCGNDLTVIKRAPYLHKRKQDLNKVLLDKFHNLWKYKVSDERQMEIGKQLSISLTNINK